MSRSYRKTYRFGQEPCKRGRVKRHRDRLSRTTRRAERVLVFVGKYENLPDWKKNDTRSRPDEGRILFNPFTDSMVSDWGDWPIVTGQAENWWRYHFK